MLAIATALLLASPAWLYPSTHDYYIQDMSPWYGLTTSTSCATEPSTTPRWTATVDAYTLKMVLPEMERDTIAASLYDHSMVKVVGKRKIEGCQCEPRAVREVNLPYRARAEDVNVAITGDDGMSVLTVKLARGRSDESKPDSPIPLQINTKNTITPTDEAKELRFIPHPSATEEVFTAAAATSTSTVEAQERTLTDKFRAAAQAAVAVTSESAPAAAQANEVAP
jgi:hypothetical protein